MSRSAFLSVYFYIAIKNDQKVQFALSKLWRLWKYFCLFAEYYRSDKKITSLFGHFYNPLWWHFNRYSDVGDKVILASLWCTIVRCWWQDLYVDCMFNVRSRSPTFLTCHRHKQYPTSVTNMEVTMHNFFRLKLLHFRDVNSPNRINLPSSHPLWRLFSYSLIHIFAARSAMRAALFYWDGL